MTQRLDLSAEDREVVAFCPTGCRHTLLLIAFLKNILTTHKMQVGERLRFLDRINNCVDNYVTVEMLALIQPMDDTQIKMFLEARKLDDPKDKLGNASFNLLTSEQVFGHFLRLNPSLLNAIRQRAGIRKQEAAAIVAPEPEVYTPDPRLVPPSSLSHAQL